jgi:hypothetical protein
VTCDSIDLQPLLWLIVRKQAQASNSTLLLMLECRSSVRMQEQKADSAAQLLHLNSHAPSWRCNVTIWVFDGRGILLVLVWNMSDIPASVTTCLLCNKKCQGLGGLVLDEA